MRWFLGLAAVVLVSALLVGVICAALQTGPLIAGVAGFVVSGLATFVYLTVTEL